MVTVGSLFSGVGGLDLGLERAGMKVIWQAENDPYASQVLSKHWPSVPNHGDVERVDWGRVERAELVCGGFPCPPVSRAGRRRGPKDERWLWPEFARCIKEVEPTWIVIENVPGLLDPGMGMAEVIGDLAACGFDAEWDLVPALAVGAPHIRYRLFIVAHSNRESVRVEPGRRSGARGEGSSLTGKAGEGVADADSLQNGGLHERWQDEDRALESSGNGAHVAHSKVFFTERPRLCSCEQGRFWGRRSCDCGSSFLDWSDGEVIGDGRVAPSTIRRVADGIPNRVDRNRVLGNAVVPQVAQFIGEQIMRVSSLA